MTIYFGTTGIVELKRNSGRAFRTSLDPADVNTTKKRFSVDFVDGAILTGDQIKIETEDGSTLELVSGHSHPDGRWYVYVDDAGGMRLYSTFSASLTGTTGEALTLVAPSSAKDIKISTSNSRYRNLAKIKEFEIQTERENIDITLLGDEFRKRYDRGMISGQGSLDCIWEHKTDPCSDGDTMPEFPVYLAQLAVRIQQGSDFDARFYIYHEPSASQNSVWYESTCLINNVAINVPAAGVIEAKVDFITSGSIVLKTGLPDAYLLQENTDRILQEDGTPILLEDPTS
jgi:hypothetical protein